MKMNRSELKSLIKECLVEILTDGLGDNLSESVRHVARPRTIPSAPVRTPQPQRRSPLDSVVYDKNPRISTKPPVNETIRQLTSDPIMASIFQDTANTTLRSQENPKALPSGGTDMASRVMNEVSDPIQIFGEDAAMRWTEAAFAPPRGGARIDFNPYEPTPDMKKA